MYNKKQKTIDYLVSRCPELTKADNIQRHTRATVCLHWNFCKHENTKDKYYEDEPSIVTENEATILCDRPILIHEEI